MGGSGGSIQIGGGGGGIDGEECPRKFECILVDVIQAGNTDYSLGLATGTKLDFNILPKETSVVLMYAGKNIGYLPPNRLNITNCIKQGWKYSATISNVSGDANNPQIKILVIGIPN